MLKRDDHVCVRRLIKYSAVLPISDCLGYQSDFGQMVRKIIVVGIRHYEDPFYKYVAINRIYLIYLVSVFLSKLVFSATSFLI